MHLATNLTALASAIGDHRALPEDRGQVALSVGTDGQVLHLIGPRGGRVALNTRRNPLAEAHGILDRALGGRTLPPTVAVIGVGLGYIIDAIEERSANTTIVALEPEPDCVRHLLQRRDFSELFASRRLLLLWGPAYSGGSEGWRYFRGATDQEWSAVSHPVLAREMPARVEAATRLAREMAFGAQSNAAARTRFAGPYLVNTLRNLPTIVTAGDAASWSGRCTGVPAIVAAGGPSLDHTVDQLREVNDRALIISVDTAARVLLSQGIAPHCIVGVDPQEANAMHLAGLAGESAACLVAEGSLHPSTFLAFPDATDIFHVSNHDPWPWLASVGIGCGRLRAWGSVLTTAFDFALMAGCDPVILVGADLAYTDSRPYCRGTAYEARWAAAVAAGASLPDVWRALRAKTTQTVPGIDGEPIEAPRHFLSVRDWLVEQAGLAGRRVINAGGRGILYGPTVEQASLMEALRCAPSRPALFLELRTRRTSRPHEALSSTCERLQAAVADDGGLARLLEGWSSSTDGTIDVGELRRTVLESVRAVASGDNRGGQPCPPAQLPVEQYAALVTSTAARSRQARARALATVSQVAWPPEAAAVSRALARGEVVPEWAVAVARLGPRRSDNGCYVDLARRTVSATRLIRPMIEEQLLLGSEYYAANPIYPLERTAAVVNLEMLNAHGRTRDLTVIGLGQSDLDDYAREAAARQGRVLKPDPEPERGMYYRSDHFSFARRGVPAFEPDHGDDFIGKPPGHGLEVRKDFFTNLYHKPSDTVKPDWDLSGGVEDLQLFWMVGYRVAQADVRPQWKPGAEFSRPR